MPCPALKLGHGWLAALVAITTALALPGASSAASAPKVGPLTVMEGSETGTVEAVVKPEGLRTEYEFWLEGPRKGFGCGSSSPCEPPAKLVASGYVEADIAEELVSARMTDLEGSSWYTARLSARNVLGAAEPSPDIFETGLPEPILTVNPYEREDPGGTSDEQSSRKQVEATELERREASERSAREASERELAATPPAPKCEVPRLKGDTLRTARAALLKAQCRLGRVHHPKHSRGELVILWQSPRAGAKLAENASVTVILSSRPTSKARR